MGNPKDYHFKLPTSSRPQNVSLDEDWYPGVQAYWDSCTTRRSVHPINGIRAIVIHATAGASSAGAVSVMKAGKASFHWLVPDEDEPAHGKLVWACAPETLAAWHVQNSKSHPEVNNGEKRVNHWSLGVEVVNRQAGGDPFSDWQIEATAQIVRHCWSKYPNLVDVVSHAKLDPTRRTDPGANFDWARFKKLVTDTPDAPQSETAQKTLAAATAHEAVDGEICC